MPPFTDYLRNTGVLPRNQEVPVALPPGSTPDGQLNATSLHQMISAARQKADASAAAAASLAARQANAQRVAATLSADQSRLQGNPGVSSSNVLPNREYFDYNNYTSARTQVPAGGTPASRLALAEMMRIAAAQNERGPLAGLGDQEAAALHAIKDSAGNFAGDPSLASGLGVVGAVGSLIPGVNKPYEWHAGVIGDVMYLEATKTGDSDPSKWQNYDPVYNTNADMQKWALAPENEQRIVEAREKGIDSDGDGIVDLKGGDAVFSLYMADTWSGMGDNDIPGFINMLVSNAVIDPLTWAGIGAASAGGVVRNISARAANGVSLSLSEKMLLYAARVAENTLTVPNAVADAPFNAVAKVGDSLLGGLVKPSSREIAREAEGARLGAIEELDQASAQPPIVQPQLAELAPEPGPDPLALPAPRMESFTPATNVLPDGPEIAVTPEGQGLTDTPSTVQLPAEPSAPTIAEVPVRTRGNYTYVGPTGEFRVTSSANGEGVLSTRNDKGGWSYGATFDSVDEAVDQATAAVRDRTTATTTPEVQPPQERVTWGDNRPLPRTYETDTQRASAIQRGEITQFTPVYGGTRPIDRVFTKSFDDPDAYTRYRAFETEVTEPLVNAKIRQRNISDKYYQTFDEKIARETLNGLDATVDAVIPAIKRNFPDEPIDPRTMSRDRGASDTGKKLSFRDENIGYLIQRAVYNGDDAALAVVKHRLGPEFGNEVARQIQDQRGRLARALASSVDEIAPLPTVRPPDAPISPATRQANAAFRAQEEARFRPVKDWNDLIRAADERVHGVADDTAPLSETALPADDAAIVADPLVRTPDVIERMVRNGRLSAEAGDQLLAPVIYRKTPKSEPREASLFEIYDEIYNTADPSLSPAQKQQSAINELERGMRESGVKQGRAARTARTALKVYDTASQVTREGIQYNIVTGYRGSVGDAIGDFYSLMIRGKPVQALRSLAGPLVAPVQLGIGKVTGNEGSYGRIMRVVDGGDSAMLNDLPEMAPITETGARIPKEFLPRSFEARSDVPTTGDMTIQRGVMSLTGGRGRKPIGAITGVFANKTLRNLRTSLDLHKRVTTWADQYRRGLGEAEDTWRTTHLDRIARKNGVDPSVWMQEIQDVARARVEDSGGKWWGGFEPEDVRVATGSDELARQWRGETNRLSLRAKNTVESILFSYKRNNADELMSRTAFFHYWQSRALAMHARAAIKNPWLLANYYRTWQALKEKAEKDNYPDSVTGYLQFMGDSTNGWFGLFNPAGIVVPFTMFSEGSNREDAPFWERVGVFLNPLVEGAAAAMGMVDSVPDPTGTSSPRNFIISTANWMKAHDIPLFGGDTLTEDRIRAIEAAVYGMANTALQKLKITDKEYGPYDPHNGQVVQIRSRIQQIAEGQYGDPATWTSETKDLVDDAMARVETGTDGNPLSEQAFEDFTDAQMGGTLARAAIPGGVSVPYAPLEEDRDLASSGYEKLAAGQEPTPEEQAAMDVQGQVNAGSPDDIALQRQQSDYYDIGTERQKNLSEGWVNIAKSTDLPEGYYEIDGKRVYTGYLMTLSDDARMELADRWVANHDGTDELSGYREDRKAFVAAHPEYGDFDSYKDAVYAYKGGPAQFRKDMIAEGNPNFERAVKEQEARWKDKSANVRKKELDNWTVSLAGYEAATGIQGGIYDAEPLETGTGWKSLAAQDKILNGEYGGSGSGDYDSTASKVGRLKKQIADVATKEALFLQATGTTPDQFTANPIMESVFKQRGIWVDIPESVQLFRDWASLQPPGAPTTPEAYYAFVDSLTEEVAA